MYRPIHFRQNGGRGKGGHPRHIRISPEEAPPHNRQTAKGGAGEGRAHSAKLCQPLLESH